MDSVNMKAAREAIAEIERSFAGGMDAYLKLWADKVSALMKAGIEAATAEQPDDEVARLGDECRGWEARATLAEQRLVQRLDQADEVAKLRAEIAKRITLPSDIPLHIQLRMLLDREAAQVAKLRTERDAAQERVDLDIDEFQRILAELADLRDGIPRPDAGRSLYACVKGLCDRAIAAGRQRVPLIGQRDRAEAERDALKAKLAALVSAIGSIDVLDELLEQLCMAHGTYLDRGQSDAANAVRAHREANGGKKLSEWVEALRAAKEVTW